MPKPSLWKKSNVTISKKTRTSLLKDLKKETIRGIQPIIYIYIYIYVCVCVCVCVYMRMCVLVLEFNTYHFSLFLAV